MPSLRTLRRTHAPLGPSLALLAVVSLLLIGQRVVGAALDRTLHGSGRFPAWLPTFGSVGQTAVVYTTAFDVLTFVVLPALLVWFGYALGRARSESIRN